MMSLWWEHARYSLNVAMRALLQLFKLFPPPVPLQLLFPLPLLLPLLLVPLLVMLLLLLLPLLLLVALLLLLAFCCTEGLSWILGVVSSAFEHSWASFLVAKYASLRASSSDCTNSCMYWRVKGMKSFRMLSSLLVPDLDFSRRSRIQFSNSCLSNKPS